MQFLKVKIFRFKVFLMGIKKQASAILLELHLSTNILVIKNFKKDT